jgi:hypothetical protein
MPTVTMTPMKFYGHDVPRDAYMVEAGGGVISVHDHNEEEVYVFTPVTYKGGVGAVITVAKVHEHPTGMLLTDTTMETSIAHFSGHFGVNALTVRALLEKSLLANGWL